MTNKGGGGCRGSDTLHSRPGFGQAGIGPQVKLFVFDGPPQALDEDIVASAPRTGPFPSMLIPISRSASTLIKSMDVNWLA